MSRSAPIPCPNWGLARHPLSLFLGLMVAAAGWLLGGCQALAVDAEEAGMLARALGLRPGMAVADVGAGDGDMTWELAERVGPVGKVWATEVTDELVADLRDGAADRDHGNVEVVLGDQQRTGLPAACCDAVLLRLVYHHFTDPPAMRADLRRALRPGGRLVIVDIVPQSDWRQLDGVPERGGHGIEHADLVREMTGDGFEVVTSHEPWNDDEERFAVVFRVAE